MAKATAAAFATKHTKREKQNKQQGTKTVMAKLKAKSWKLKLKQTATAKNPSLARG